MGAKSVEICSFPRYSTGGSKKRRDMLFPGYSTDGVMSVGVCFFLLY